MLDMKKIEEISKGVDEHLRKLESFTGLLKQIKVSLDELRLAQERYYLHELQQMKRDYKEISDQLRKYGLPQSNQYEKQLEEMRMLLDGSAWPLATPEEAICNSEEKAIKRADAIIDLLIGEHMKGKRFLDYGCGGGHVVVKSLERETKFSLGYDVNLSECKHTNNVTSDFNDVKGTGPFDIILLHDVLDHAVMIDPIEILKQVRSVLNHKGRVYVRNHPWSSRHGGHLYMQKNKAFLHLVFDPIELTRIGGFSPEHNVGVTSPLDTYRYWFKESGFKIINEIPIKDKVEDFFSQPSRVNDRLKKHFQEGEIIVNHLEISFVEYTLEADELYNQIF